MLKKLYLILLFFIVATTGAVAQQSVDVNFNGMAFLDNREYKAFIPRSRTYSGTRTALDFGLNIDSLHHFIVGANAMHEFGAVPFFRKVDPIAYYKYGNANTNWNFYAGSFSREGLLGDYPRALLNDTLRYYRPNVEGLMARFQNEHFTETAWIDWVSRQTLTQREQFLFGLSGKYKPRPYGPFYVSHYFLLMHDAGAEVLLPTDHITDNGGAEIRLGMDFSHKTVFDSLTVEAGGLMSLERSRGVDGFRTPKGFVFKAFLSYRKFALYEEFYRGQGSNIIYGDSYYSKPTYNRVDLIYTPFLTDRIKGQFVFSFHMSPGNLNDNQQVFRVSYDLGRKILKRFDRDL